MEQAKWDDNHLVAYIEVWGSPPQGFPLSHTLYQLDTAKGWCYLTAASLQTYHKNKEEIDQLKALQLQRLSGQIDAAIEDLFTSEVVYTARREEAFYALVLTRNSAAPERFEEDSPFKNLKDLQERVRTHYGTALFMAPTDFQTEVEHRKIHTPEMITLLQGHAELYGPDLPAYYVYGSRSRQVSGSWAHIEGAVYIQTNQQETGCCTYIAVPERLNQDIIEDYELTFVSGPITQHLGSLQN